MVHPPTFFLAPERQPDIDLRFEHHARVRAVQAAMLRTTKQLMAAYALGRPLDALFAELEVLGAAEAREAEALAIVVPTAGQAA